MNSEYKEICRVAKWFWLRALCVIGLLVGIALYFFYDWKVGYPKKNFHLVQYETFEKARDYFLEHVKRDGTKEQWTSFVAEQEMQYFKQRDIVEYSLRRSVWPSELQNYKTYQTAYEAKGDSSEPAMWESFLAENVAYVKSLEAKSTESKEDRVAYEKAVRWDLPLPEGIEKNKLEANYRLTMYRTFQEAEEIFKRYQKEEKGQLDWELLASCRDLAFPEDRSITPLKYQNEMWPAMLGDYDRYYAAAKEDIESKVEINEPYLWKEYTGEKKLGEKAPDAFKERKRVDEQLYFGIGCLVVAALAALYALRMKSRYMAVDNEAYYAPGGMKIPFSDLYKIDKRKWDTKGLATLFYKENGVAKKTKVDGMVYGQFDKKAGQPAQKLFDVIMKNFKGEVIEFAEEAGEESVVK